MSPKIVNGLLTDDEKKDITTSRDTTRFVSRLQCFRVTNGVRPREFSVIVGKSGNGKSALCKTMGFEAVKTDSKTKVYFILSEEKAAIYKSTLTDAFESSTRAASEYLERIYFDSMLEWDNSEKTLNFFLEHVEEQINEIDIDMLIFDNFTTSFIGQLPISEQGRAIDSLRRLAADYEIAIIGVFHTVKGTDIYNKILDGEDVRGNATSTNAGAYNYILTTYFRADPIKAILHIDKARYHKEANKTYWELNYDKDLELYTAATKTNFEEVNLIVGEVNLKAKDKLKTLKGGNKW